MNGAETGGNQQATMRRRWLAGRHHILGPWVWLWKKPHQWRQWLQHNTFVPSWLPKRWQHPLTGYVVAAAGCAFAVIVTGWLIQEFPDFSFPGALVTILVVFLALNWGAGPSLMATMLGPILVHRIDLHDQGIWPLTRTSTTAVLDLFLLVCVLGCVSFMASQTGRTRAEARAMAQALREANQRMDEFLSITSHELRTPLTSILGYVQLALDLTQRATTSLADAEQDTKLLSQLNRIILFLQRADHQITHINRLVSDLLNASRVQMGRFDIQPAPNDLAAIVGNVVEEQRRITPTRTITLCREASQNSADESVPVVADADRIAQVIANYLTNALRYSNADLPVEVGLRVRQDVARVWVRDCGPGIPLTEQENIWTMYYRAPGIMSAPDTGGGLGLGLAISRIIVERHKGQVGVESSPGQGATFWFTLPLARPPQQM